ncbi:MAG: hypothetical protein IH935_11570, partial [Acidobacteria bacterium]|nr:hypothetical protein [Acidobacteriota bacterium]
MDARKTPSLSLRENLQLARPEAAGHIRRPGTREPADAPLEHASGGGPRYFTSFLFGSAFAAGWTPCVGAALGAFLGLAATQPGKA